MYRYISALALPKTTSAQWKEYDLHSIMLREIYAKFTQTFITVTENLTNETFIVDMDAYRTTLSASSLTVDEWLITQNGKPLISVPDLPNKNMRYAKYHNAIMAGYKIQRTRMGYNYPAEYPLQDLPDLALTRDKIPTDMTLIHKHCMASVNGFYHRTDTDGTKAFIVDGAVTASMIRCPHIGLLSFLDMAEITQYKIKPEHIIPSTEGMLLKQGLKFVIEEDLTDKSIIFILGGYMIMPEANVFWQVSDNSFEFNINAIPYVQRYFESRVNIDLTSMKVDVEDNGTDNVVVESLFSDEVIRQYFDLSQTFVVIVNTPKLYTEKINVRVSNLPGFLTAFQDPVWPLVMGYGKMVEYTKIKEVDRWALRIDDPYYKHYAFQETRLKLLPVVSSHLIPYDMYYRTDGYMLSIGGTPTV